MIIKLPDGRYQLRSKNGRKMGTFDTKGEARKKWRIVKRNKESEEMTISEGYYSELDAGLIEPPKKIKIKLTDKQKKEKEEKDKEFRNKFIVPLKTKRKPIAESVAGIAAPDMAVNGPTVKKISLTSERGTDLHNMYGDALNKSEEDKQSDSEAKDYVSVPLKIGKNK